ncbi:hypothetical protein ACLOJK_036644 [Asimina triloba]
MVGRAFARSYFRIRCRANRLSAVGPNALLGDRLLFISFKGGVPSLVRVFSARRYSGADAFPVGSEEERGVYSEEAVSSVGRGGIAQRTLAHLLKASPNSPAGVTSLVTDHRDERRALFLHEQSQETRSCFQNVNWRCGKLLGFRKNWRCLGLRWHASKHYIRGAMFDLWLWLNIFEVTFTTIERSSSAPTIIKVGCICVVALGASR